MSCNISPYRNTCVEFTLCKDLSCRNDVLPLDDSLVKTRNDWGLFIRDMNLLSGNFGVGKTKSVVAIIFVQVWLD